MLNLYLCRNKSFLLFQALAIIACISACSHLKQPILLKVKEETLKLDESKESRSNFYLESEITW